MHSTCSNDFTPRPAFEVEIVPTPANKTGQWRFLTPVRREKISPCRKLCPLESAVPLWVNKVREGDWEGAWSIIRQYNPFPAITGYTCYRFCQQQCSRSSLDEPVDIGEIEKAIGLWRHENFVAGGTRHKLTERVKNGRKKVAVVGSGPAGLSCAFYLNLLGAEVTVFEKLPLPGGLLVTGIPEYRLPRSVLRKELEILQSEGVIIKTGVELGKDFTLQDLEHNFQGVVLAVGAQMKQELKVAGETLPGVIGAIEFLSDIHLGKTDHVPRRIIVAGGGNAAVDAACVAKLKGAEEVTLLYRRPEEQMPAHPHEISAAKEAGVKFIFQAAIAEICGAERAEKVRAVRTAPSRRGEPLQILPDTDFYLECDALIIAAGEKSALPAIAPFSFSAEGYAEAKNIFAAGDALNGPANVAKAIFSGRKAALYLAEFLWPGEKRGELFNVAPPFCGEAEAVSLDELNILLFSRQKRFSSPQKEAERCFSCGTCNSCGICWIFCPDLAIDPQEGNFEILLDYCKGCGICVRECPSGVLRMEVNPYGG